MDHPAKLVGYGIDVVNEHIVLFEDIPVIFNDTELQRCIGTYHSNPGFDPEPEEWGEWDGTPYGAIDDLLMDADGDGDWDDFDADGVPDDWD